MHQTAIDQAQERVEELRRQIHDEVTADVHRDLRRQRWRRVVLRLGGCCLVYLVTILAIPAVALVLVARTGLVDIPVFSDVVRHEATPTRAVVVPASGDASAFLPGKLRGALRAPRSDGTVALALSESELTGMLRAAVSGAAPTVRDAQVAVQADAVEVYARVPGVAGVTSGIRILGVPSIANGRLAFAVRTFTVGAVRLPRPLGQLIADRILAALPPIPAILGGPAGLTPVGVAVRSGTIDVVLRAE